MLMPETDRLNFTGRLILISGGAGALGRAISTALHSHGADVVTNDVVDRSAVVGLDPAATYIKADVADPTQVANMIDEILDTKGRLPDVVCCHAGLVDSFAIQDYPIEEFDRLMRLNVRGAFVLAQAISQRWLEARVPGHLIFTTSWVQDIPWPEIGPYNSSKAAVRQLAHSFARELAPHGIRANTIAPGMVNSGMTKHLWDTDESYRARAANAIPLGYLQAPESVADAFLFLVSSMADYMTGSDLLVDGGASLYPLN